MKSPKIDTSGQRKAAEAAAAAQAAANNLQQNFAADLKTENLGQVVAGGSAADVMGTTGVRRKRQSTSLSSQLGISA